MQTLKKQIFKRAALDFSSSLYYSLEPFLRYSLCSPKHERLNIIKIFGQHRCPFCVFYKLRQVPEPQRWTVFFDKLSPLIRKRTSHIYTPSYYTHTHSYFIILSGFSFVLSDSLRVYFFLPPIDIYGWNIVTVKIRYTSSECNNAHQKNPLTHTHTHTYQYTCIRRCELKNNELLNRACDICWYRDWSEKCRFLMLNIITEG